MRSLLLGAGGMLAHDLAATVPPRMTLVPFTRSELDITDARALAAAVGSVRPDVIVNAAAYTAVDRAEAERDVAFRVNAEAVGELGRVAESVGARVIHFSTDYVFDGLATQPYREDAPTSPLNAYGASKLAGERALRNSGVQYLVIRTQWLFGVHGRSFPKTMFERANAGLATRVVADQTGRPTFSRHLARATWQLIDRCALGVVNVTNDGEATWFDVALHVFTSLGRPELVTPCTTHDYPTPARRPRYTALDTGRLESWLGTPMPTFRTALDDFLKDVTR